MNHEIPVNAVKVEDDFWQPIIMNIATNVIPYQWRILNDLEDGAEPSHSVENFKIAAGISKGEYHGKVFQDSDVAKWIEAASYSLLYNDSADIRNNLKSVINIIGEAQQPDGYLNTYYTLQEPENRWKSIGNGHELYCAGHMLEAAVAYYSVTGEDQLLRIMDRFVDYIYLTFGKGKGQLDTYPGHEEIELALVKAYRVTNDKKYLDLSKYFINNRGTVIGFQNEENYLQKAEFPFRKIDYYQAHTDIRNQKTAEGHAVRASYFFSGAADIALETGDKSLKDALNVLWKNVTQKRMYITGSIGSQSAGERFSIDYDLPNDTAYNESCAAVGMANWAYRMLKLNLVSEYADVMERVLYNGIISGISFDGKRYFYVNPLFVKPDVAHFRDDQKHVKTNRVKWFGCACCPPNIVRTVSSIGNYIYTRREDDFFMHLYIGNESNFTVKNGDVHFRIVSGMPWNGKTVIRISGSGSCNLHFRIPEYASNYKIIYNGIETEFSNINGYTVMKHEVSDGDIIEIKFDFCSRFVASNPRVTENNGRVAVLRGPIVYCAEQTDNFEYLNDFDVDTSKPIIKKTENIAGSNVIAIKIKGTRSDFSDWKEDSLYADADRHRRQNAELKMIPYFLWNNRGEGEMLVWVRKG